MSQQRYDFLRPTWAEIDLQALESNFRLVQGQVGADVKVMGVVKANAYGHGSLECARRVAKAGAAWLGVATPEEGLELREAGISLPILLFGGFSSGHAAILLQSNLVPVIYRADLLKELDNAAAERGIVADAHIEIDSGMGRLGVRYDEVPAFIESASGCRNVRIDGLMTHFASADIPALNSFTRTQTERYETALRLFSAAGFSPTFCDLANSAATMSHPYTHGDMVRPGGVLYGLWGDILQPGFDGSAFKPVMSVHSRIALLKRVSAGQSLGYGCTYTTQRESLIATIPIGYDDGLVRASSNNGYVLIRGQQAPIVGRVSMDLTILDVTDVEAVAADEEVTIIGESGGQWIRAEEVAGRAKTLSYEITCGISQRVPRVFVR